MNEERLRSDWDALSKEEKEEALNAFKCAFEAMKHATIVLSETVIKAIPELLKSDTNDFTGAKENEEGVL